MQSMVASEGRTAMAQLDDKRPPTDNETIQYCVTLLFVVVMTAIITNALCGCATLVAY